ncbi:MAG: winged helix-turn-helix domain-containing protein [Candidatus Bathyarchaeota archaeon]|nr:winged helix-turn-helix domain-containing protein [Candidatus Bathyarchaeota archaeon]
MKSDLASLHKILKDGTRQKIISLLAEKGSLTYTELMDSTDITSTGTLNYHLKILGELLAKNDAGQYILTEKGKLAARLLDEFPPDYSLEAKKIWSRRFLIVAVAINIGGLLLVIVLNILGYLDIAGLYRGIFGFITGLVFFYVFYRMIRPTTNAKSHQKSNTPETNPDRTIKDIFVSGRSLQEVNDQICQWIRAEGITVEVQHEDFFRGRLGIPSGLGLTAPKYFEISCTVEPKGVKVHTEGWISVYDVREQSFSSNPWVMGNIPRRKGQKVIEHLWAILEAISEK